MSYRLNEGMLVEDIDGESVIVTPDGDACVLNETGSLVLKGIIGNKEPANVLATITNSYAIDKIVANKDMQEIIDNLLKANLILEE